MNEVKIISELTGILVKNNLSALEALEALEETKKVFLERSWHIASEKQHAIKDQLYISIIVVIDCVVSINGWFFSLISLRKAKE